MPSTSSLDTGILLVTTIFFYKKHLNLQFRNKNDPRSEIFLTFHSFVRKISLSILGKGLRHISTHFGLFWWSRWTTCVCHCQVFGHEDGFYTQVKFLTCICFCLSSLNFVAFFAVRYSGILSAYGLALADVVNEAQEPSHTPYTKGALLFHHTTTIFSCLTINLND